LTYLLKRIAGFPRTYRFVLGERIGHLAIDILEYLLEATYTRHKKPALDRANLGLEKLRHLLRSRYRDFEIGVLLKQAREAAGLTQKELADRIGTKKTAISRLENHAEDIKLSTLRKVTHALGRRLELTLK
jgi:DNA-binding XRE family transcriptional regulator